MRYFSFPPLTHVFFSNQKQDVSQISKNLCLKKLQKQIGQGLRKMST